MLMIRGRALSDCNRAAVELLECRSAADMLGQPLGRFSPEVQPDGQDSSRKLAGLLRRAQVGAVAQCEWPFCRAVGRHARGDKTLARVRDKGAGTPYAPWSRCV